MGKDGAEMKLQGKHLNLSTKKKTGAFFQEVCNTGLDFLRSGDM